MYSFNEEQYYPQDISTNKLTQLINTEDDQILYQHGIFPKKYVNKEHHFYIDSNNRTNSETPVKFKIMFGSHQGDGIIYNIDLDHFSFLHLKEIHVPLRFLSTDEINSRNAIMRIDELFQDNIHYANPMYNEQTDVMLFKIGNNKTHNIYETKTVIDLKNNYQKKNSLHFQFLNENADPINIISDKNINENPLNWEIVYNTKKIENVDTLKEYIERFKEHTATYQEILTESNKYNMSLSEYLSKLNPSSDAVTFMNNVDVQNDIMYVKERLPEFSAQNSNNNMIIEMRLGIVGKQPMAGLM